MLAFLAAYRHGRHIAFELTLLAVELGLLGKRAVKIPTRPATSVRMTRPKR